MKKSIILVILTAALVLAFSACTSAGGSTEAEATSTTEASGPVAGQFSVGYARIEITPEGDGYPLGGYGRTDTRLSNGYLDRIYTTAIAFVDEQGEKFFMVTTDIINTATYSEEARKLFAETLGVSEDNILITATHTHSMVDLAMADKFPIVKAYKERVIHSIADSCVAALADAKPASMGWGTVDLTGYNFVRHYFSDTGLAVGDNHNSSEQWGWNQLVGHTTESNHIMYMLKIAREDAKDILLCNWRAHPTVTGGSTKQNISGDYVAVLRQQIEKESDCLFAYFQGEAGNQNPRTRMDSTFEYNPPSENKAYGKEMSDKINAAYASIEWENIPTGRIYTLHENKECNVNHAFDGYYTEAVAIVQAWTANGWTSDITTMLQNAGLFSPYQCNAIATRKAAGKTAPDSLHATVIGDLIITNEMSEMFDTNGTFVRDNSPSKYTLVMSYTDGNGYIPSQFAYEYGCYEADTGRFEAGTGEILAKRLVEMAQEAWKETH